MKVPIAWFARLVPRPRMPGVGWGWLHPALAVAATATAAVLLAASDLVVFASPSWFLLLLVAPWLWWMIHARWHGLPRRRAAVALWVRFLFLAVCAATLAEPRMVRSSNDLGLVYLYDASDSISRPAKSAAKAWILDTEREKPERDDAGMVVFAASAGVQLPVRSSFPLPEEMAVNLQVDKAGTDLGAGLRLAGALLPDDRPGRIVLISDGVHNGPPFDAEIDDLAARGIPVDVLPITYDLQREVWVEKLTLPRHLKIGETYNASVVLSSLRPGEGELVLEENGREIYRDRVAFRAGKNAYRLPIRMRGAGYYEYAATVRMLPGREDEDFWTKNNTAINSVHLKGRGRILVVADRALDRRALRPFLHALEESKRLVERREPHAVPQDALSLLPYDSVVLFNVAADQLDELQQRAIHDAVYNLGAGLLMVGGENSFGAGGWQNTRIEKALPVEMEVKNKKFLPKGALAIVLHTCEFAQGNAWAKKITKKAIAVLSSRDEVGVLLYDWNTGPSWLFPLTPAGDSSLPQKVNAAAPGDMPDFGSTLNLCYQGLRKSDAATKHVIVISDGDPSPPNPSLLKKYVQAGISISTVTIFPHRASDNQMMKHLANFTGGTNYFPQNANLLPAIFIKEAKTLRRSLLQNKDVRPVRCGYSPVLKGLGGVPVLHGYVLTTLKGGRARKLLDVPGEEEDQRDTILATWRYGLGKTAAFTSGLGGNWGKDWLAWERYRGFVQQLMTDISRSQKQSYLDLRVMAEGGQGIVEIEDHHPEGGFLRVAAKVVRGEDESRAVEMRCVGPGRYRGTFPITGLGRYQVLASAVGAGRKESLIGGLVVPYSREYARFTADPATLERISERTGGRVLDDAVDGRELFAVERQRRSTSRPVFPWFLALAAILLVLDVAFRRVQVDLQVLAELFRRRAKSTGADSTLGRLMARKKAISFGTSIDPDELRSAAEAERAAAAAKPSTGPKRAPAGRAPAERAPGVPGGKELSTTARLLELRRKRQEEDEGEAEG